MPGLEIATHDSTILKIPSVINDRLRQILLIAKHIINRFLPSSIRNRLWLEKFVPIAIAVPALTLNYAYDIERFLKWSAVAKKVKNQTNLRALITMDYHRIEKGLALKETRCGFGPEIVKRLLSNLKTYQINYGFDETGQIALNVLFAYYNFNLAHGLKDEELCQALIALNVSNGISSTCQGGVVKVTKNHILEAAQLNLEPFFNSRYSIRHFSAGNVDISSIEKALLMAQKTPSVCNRQSSKVYVFSSDEDKKNVLSYQNGNRGFGDQASKILIVTSDLENFVSIGERNQCWIDGGMYAMSLIYALHSLGLGTCCLNWSVMCDLDRNLRQAAGISNSESIIMMIAVGHLPDELQVAQSPRKRVDEVLIVK